MGRVTAPENVRWFISIWAWFVLLLWVELHSSSLQILLLTFFFVFFASAVPFFCRRVGLFRWWLFGWLVPVIAAVIVLQCLRLFLHFA